MKSGLLFATLRWQAALLTAGNSLAQPNPVDVSKDLEKSKTVAFEIQRGIAVDHGHESFN